jgi:hypothetical protein
MAQKPFVFVLPLNKAWILADFNALNGKSFAALGATGI